MLVWKQYLRCNFLLWSNKDNCFRLFICHESKFYLQHHTCGSHAYSNVILSPRARMMLFKLMLILELDTIQKKISISTFLSLDRLWWRYIILTTDLVFGIKKKPRVEVSCERDCICMENLICTLCFCLIPLSLTYCFYYLPTHLWSNWFAVDPMLIKMEMSM